MANSEYPTQTKTHIIRIFNGCEVRIENSVILDNSASLVMLTSYPK